MSHYFRIVEGEALRNEGRIYLASGGIIPEFTPIQGLSLIKDEAKDGLEINNCALRNVEIIQHATGVISRCMLSQVAIVGKCHISNFDWGGRGYMAFKNAYISGWEDINILPSPEDYPNWDIITYPNLDSYNNYKEIYNDGGWYQAYATSKRNITLRVRGTQFKTGLSQHDLYCYTSEGLEWIALYGNPDNNSIEKTLYEHLKSEGYFYPS